MKMQNVRCSNYVYIRTTRCNVAGHHLSIPSSLRTFTKKQIKQVLRHLMPFKNFLNLKSLTMPYSFEKVKWSTSYHSYQPKSGAFSLFPRGQLPGTPDPAKPQTSRPWTMSPSVSLLELVLVQQRVLSPIRHLGSMEMYGDDDMTWYDMPLLIRTQLHVTVYVIHIYIYTIDDICLCIFSKFLGQKKLTIDSSMKAKGYQMC